MTSGIKSLKKDIDNHDDIKKSLGLKKIYGCDECGNKYLHYSALYAHKKRKHGNTPNFKKKNKKFDISISPKKPKKEAKKVSRRKFQVEDSFLATLKGLAEKLRPYYLIISAPNRQYPLYQAFMREDQKAREKMTCDEIFASYLKDTSSASRPIHFSKRILPMIIIFREFLNIQGPEYKRMLIKNNVIDQFEETIDYCCFYTAEDIPELSNDFFNFLNAAENFYTIFGVTEKELLEEFMKLFTWLFERDFISYKIFMIGN